MEIINTEIEGLFIIKTIITEDKRGYFEKLYSKRILKEKNLISDFVDLNHSKSLTKGIFRGFHYQKYPNDEVKLIRCLRGKINDYIIDMRENSKTFLRVWKFELSESNKYMLYIPSGLAHGFQTLVDDTEVIYFSSNYFSKESELVINCLDPTFSIQFEITPVLSEKDKSASFITNIKDYLI